MYDIAIIGLGPAGANLARLLSCKFKVITLDKSNGEAGFRKPCGGLLAPDAQKILSRFNLALPKSILVDPQIFSVRTIDVKAKIIRHYQRFYINMDRLKFDAWMRSLIPLNVEISLDTVCTKIERTDTCYKIDAVKGGKGMTIQARYVIGADGANSIVRRTFFPKFKIRQYLAIQQWFENSDATPFYSSVFDANTTDCYAWGISKDSHFIFGGAFKVKGARENFESLKQKVQAFGFQTQNPAKTEACLVLRPAAFNKFCHGSDGAFLVGEAAGFISPSSLEGISYALQSSYELSAVLNKNCKKPVNAYKKATAKIRRKLFFKNLKIPFMYFPPFRRMIMKSGLKSVAVLPPEK